MGRIWNLRLNLDTLNSLYMSAFTESAKADAFMGLMVGLNGGEITEQCSSIVRAAFELGSDMRGEAHAYIAAKAEAGKKSATVRKEKLGTDQPKKSSETGSQTAEQCSSSVRTDPRTPPEPILQDGNPLKEVTVQPENNTSASKKPRRSLKEKLDDLDGYSDEATRIVRACCEFWPVDNGESRKLKEDPFTAAARVDEILKQYDIDGGLLIESARKYIEKMRGSGSTKFIKCLHFYFGPGKQGVNPTWRDEVKALNHDRKNNA